ncbi:GNAT family N-acetyltransferase [Streptomyces odontomachi]|uniref:GNAT family N-acetyltransferase n=1 Tax=Streptomyces odontomachi TaxID=2944940 RepID=UPI00210B7433|nr:GNAT family protein [Streptomyces sp. ODS25]
MPDSDHVHLRPITEQDLDLLERLHDDPAEAGELGFFGYRDPRQLRRQWAENGFLSPQGGRLAVAGDEGRLIGEVQWHEVRHGFLSPCWNIGISLLTAERGKGHGTRAQRQLVEYLFAHTKANRIEAGTEVVNIPEQRALERAGFTREGVLRGAYFRGGVWRDMAQYSVLRAEVVAGA